MQLALENFKQLTTKPKFLVLGDMFELGKTSQEEHQEVIKILEKMPFEKAFVIGENFHKTKINNKNIQKFKYFEEFKSDYKLPKKGILLVKASRGMALERLLDF
jgi:UDP-N-acetylmuramoyl-tripeptide--D-alanyl-D-alanine ligase